MTNLPGKFVWFELVSRDAKKAQAFYGEVLGWKTERMAMGKDTYDLIKLNDVPIGGYTAPEVGQPSHWISYASVADVDASLVAIKAAGGKVLAPPFDVPGIGRMAKVADPQGAAFWVMRGAGDDAADAPVTAGHFLWNELITAEPDKAVAFYKQALGYTSKAMDMGPIGTYHVLSQSGDDRGGVLKAPPGAPTSWLPYVSVDDCDATVARATKNGGTVHMAPADIPGIGRFAVLADPLGASFAVMKPAPK